MDHGTKQRVVGTVVLLMLALIFLPFILDGDGNYQPAISSRIPPTPGVQPMPEPVPQRPVIEADSYPVQEPQPEYRILDLEDSEPQPEAAAPEPDNSSAGQVAGQPPAAVSETAPAATGEPADETGPALDERSLPAGWSVRLGVFSNPRNASNLESRLLEAGYRAYTRQMSGSQGAATGVFVGPQVERADANRLKVQLQEEFKLAGLVVRFQVEPI